MVGNVYLGRVQNVLPGMEAAFIDVGKGRNAVLYAGEVNYSPEDLEGAPPRIEHVLKSGQSVLVQATKDPIGGKGARVAPPNSRPGRCVAVVPESPSTRHRPPLPERECSGRELVTEYLTGIAPDLLPKVRLHEGKLPVFEEFHVVEQIHKGLDRKVWLPSGGYIVIDRTEAMTVIDVNTGKSVGKTNLEETVVNTNVEAAREVARQLRLRDIGGMIIIDFIDMLLEQNKRKVIDALREEMAKDKTRSQIFDISPLGLLEVTRKRVSGGLLESFSETCPTCEGRGLIVTYEA